MTTTPPPPAIRAEALHLSPGTVRNHLSSVIGKTQTGNRFEAVHAAQLNGWL